MPRPLLAAALLLLSSCATTSELLPPTRADTVISAAGLPSVGKLVVRGNVIYQYAAPGGSNSAQQADNRKAGQRQGSAATGAGATSGNASKHTAGPPLAVYVVGGLLLVLAGAGGWEWLSHRGLLAWLPWRVAPS